MLHIGLDQFLNERERNFLNQFETVLNEFYVIALEIQLSESKNANQNLYQAKNFVKNFKNEIVLPIGTSGTWTLIAAGFKLVARGV